MTIANNVRFHEDGYSVRTISRKDELQQAYRFRHEVYCDTLRWVKSSPDGLEKDQYDDGSVSLAAYGNEGRLLGLARILTADHPFMIENEFLTLLPAGFEIRKERDTAEITRLTTLQPFAHQHQESRHASKLIYKGIYQWSKANGVRYLYFAVMPKFLRALRFMGFPCTAIGPVGTMGDQTECVAVLLDWVKFEEHAWRYNPKFLQWIATTEPASAGEPEQPYGSCSTRQASTLNFECGTSLSVH